jgi:hypothetical protein
MSVLVGGGYSTSLASRPDSLLMVTGLFGRRSDSRLHLSEAKRYRQVARLSAESLTSPPSISDLSSTRRGHAEGESPAWSSREPSMEKPESSRWCAGDGMVGKWRANVGKREALRLDIVCTFAPAKRSLQIVGASGVAGAEEVRLNCGKWIEKTAGSSERFSSCQILETARWRLCTSTSSCNERHRSS